MKNKKLNEEQTKCLRKYLEEDNVDGVKKCFEDSGLVPVFGPMSGAKEAHQMDRFLKKLNGDCYALVYGFENDFWEGWGSSGIDYYFSGAMVLFDWDGNIIDITTSSQPTYGGEIKDRGDYIESRGLKLDLPERAQNPEHLQKKARKQIREKLDKDESVLNFKYPNDALEIMKEYLKNNEKEIEKKQKNLLLSTPERQERAKRIWDIRKQYRLNEMRSTLDDKTRRNMERLEISKLGKVDNADRNKERATIRDLKRENQFLKNQKKRVENAPQRKELAEALRKLRKEFTSDDVCKVLPDAEQRLKVRKIRREAIEQNIRE